jgi:aminoglycoside phosphotransferase (APT) family kinase protein
VDELTERALAGGRQTHGIVRVGQTVRRSLHERSGYVHALLRHLEAVGFDGAPRLLGIDAQGREVLTYFPGEVLVRSPAWLADARLDSAARLIRGFHDATVGTPLAGDQEGVCHGDLGPHNIVFDGDTAVGIFDWDASVGPGPRLVDLGHAVWCCADVAEPAVPVAEQARKVRRMCDAYGRVDVGLVVHEVGDRFRRARDDHARAGRAKGAAIFAEKVRWMDRNAAALIRPATRRGS